MYPATIRLIRMLLILTSMLFIVEANPMHVELSEISGVLVGSESPASHTNTSSHHHHHRLHHAGRNKRDDQQKLLPMPPRDMSSYSAPLTMTSAVYEPTARPVFAPTPIKKPKQHQSASSTGGSQKDDNRRYPQTAEDKAPVASSFGSPLPDEMKSPDQSSEADSIPETTTPAEASTTPRIATKPYYHTRYPSTGYQLQQQSRYYSVPSRMMRPPKYY